MKRMGIFICAILAYAGLRASVVGICIGIAYVWSILAAERNFSLIRQQFAILGFAFSEATGLFALMMSFLLLYVGIYICIVYIFFDYFYSNFDVIKEFCYFVTIWLHNITVMLINGGSIGPEGIPYPSNLGHASHFSNNYIHCMKTDDSFRLLVKLSKN